LVDIKSYFWRSWSSFTLRFIRRIKI